MRIIGGYQDGPKQKRIILIESDDVGKEYQIDAYIDPEPVGDEGVALGISYYEDGPSGRKRITVDDPVEAGADLPPPFWVKPQPETWELMAQNLVRDARTGMVDIVAEACLQEIVIRGWQLEAWGRLHVSLARAMKEVCYG